MLGGLTGRCKSGHGHSDLRRHSRPQAQLAPGRIGEVGDRPPRRAAFRRGRPSPWPRRGSSPGRGAPRPGRERLRSAQRTGPAHGFPALVDQRTGRDADLRATPRAAALLLQHIENCLVDLALLLAGARVFGLVAQDGRPNKTAQPTLLPVGPAAAGSGAPCILNHKGAISAPHGDLRTGHFVGVARTNDHRPATPARSSGARY